MNYSAYRRFLTHGTALLLIVTATLFAGQTGKIVGKITEKKSGEPVIGVSVILQGTRSGASSDFEGEYIIGNVLPGTYTITVSSLGFKTASINNVIVKIDLTTTIDVKLEESVIEGDAVVIEAERPLVQKDLTSSSVTVSADEMKAMPVENITQVINLQAGVVDGHFRGGRTGEVAYLVDGIPVNNPLNGDAGLTPENSSVREMEVISGTFNAEYGQAMSGVVNIVTQDGSSDYHGNVGAYFGDYYTTHSDIFINLDKLDLLRTQNYQFSLSGPLLFDNFTFFTTGRYQDEDGYLFGKRIYKTTDDAPLFPNPNDKSIYFNRNTGDGAFVPMNPNFRNSLNWKLSYSFDAFKFSYGGFWEKSKSKRYEHAYKWTPDGTVTNFSENWMQNFQLNHIVSNNTFQSFKVSLNTFTGEGYLFENPYDIRYVRPDQGAAPSNYTFRSGGNQTYRYENSSATIIGQWALSAQMSKEHKIGIGVEGRLHEVFNHDRTMTNALQGQVDTLGRPLFKIAYPQLGSIGNQDYKKEPMEGSAYIQDKMEYGIMIINAGLRVDYFNPNTRILADLNNPMRNSDFDTLRTDGIKILNPKGRAGTLVKTKEKIQVSPRFGISFPITDQGIIHFSYGHFFQIPSFSNLYRNSEYIISPSSQLQSIMGNPDIDAQRTVTYELGLQQVLFTNIGVDFTVYYRDIRNLLGMEIISSYEGFKYARYINRDYGNVRGFVFAFEKRYSDFYSVRANYTFQIAEGNASDPLTVFYDNQSDPPKETNKKVVPLNWDQRSTLNVSMNVGDMGNWMVGLIGNIGAGLPYTESGRVNNGITFENGAVKPSTVNVDFRADKSIDLFGTRFGAFLLIYNIFDIKNEVNVNDASGRANVDLFTHESGAIRGLNTLQEYLNNPTSFSAPRNIRIGVNLDF
ncbi:MAG: carboxypeptidase-like regulatory domain-containing protein [Bacteroidetes bacterium]|nr:carboxypeptidase-like regulatory domain-containing protein [Bacteroidota bacterium]